MLNPKQKADEIFEEYYQLSKTLDENNNWYGIFSMKKLAKECALMSVDNILNATYENSHVYYFYVQVKEEIEKL
jgi:hypothetical protein